MSPQARVYSVTALLILGCGPTVEKAEADMHPPERATGVGRTVTGPSATTHGDDGDWDGESTGRDCECPVDIVGLHDPLPEGDTVDARLGEVRAALASFELVWSTVPRSETLAIASVSPVDGTVRVQHQKEECRGMFIDHPLCPGSIALEVTLVVASDDGILDETTPADLRWHSDDRWSLYSRRLEPEHTNGTWSEQTFEAHGESFVPAWITLRSASSPDNPFAWVIVESNGGWIGEPPSPGDDTGGE